MRNLSYFAALAAAAAMFAQPQAYDRDVRPVLDKSCAGCHNDKLKSGNLNLSAATQTPEVWRKVRDRLRAGTMPPPGMLAPSKAEVAAVTGWIDTQLAGKATVRDGDLGRVMARRLNRVEYNNTIRDLLGVPMRPADEFPVDDSGYGFDNIGDVLSVSPMLMEKYMAAAAKVARVAVFGESYPEKPTASGAAAESPLARRVRRAFYR